MYDAVIIGGGVVGCAAARELSRYNASVCVVESRSDVCMGASKANSGIVHAGFDAVCGSQKAKYNVRGAEMMPALCASLGVPYINNGALVVAFSEDERAEVERLLSQGRDNGVKGLRIVERDELMALEPKLSKDAVCALLAETSGIVSPYELTFALADDAARNGVSFILDTRVTSAEKLQSGWRLTVSGGEKIDCRLVISCAGVYSGEMRDIFGAEKLKIIPRRGVYYLLDHEDKPAFTHTMFQTPTPMGKGVLVTETTHGNLLIGPTAEDIENPDDTACSNAELQKALKLAKKTFPALSLRTNITNYAGVRAHPADDDFHIGVMAGASDALEAAGIESPGLSAAPAIGERLAEFSADILSLKKKNASEIVPPVKMPKPFREMTDDERRAACAKNPEYGAIICRCETVTLAEIRAAIRRPVPAKTVDAVKRRTRAGMGRCQSGFCLTRVMEALAAEENIPLTKVTKQGAGSELAPLTITEIGTEAAADGKD